MTLLADLDALYQETVNAYTSAVHLSENRLNLRKGQRYKPNLQESPIMTVLTRRLMLLALIFGLSALTQPAQASGTLYVSLSDAKRVVRFPIRPNLPNPGPSNFATAFRSPYGIAAYNGDLYFYDTETINGLATDVIRRAPLSPPIGTPVTATRYAMTGGRNASQMAFNTAGVLFFVGRSGNEIMEIVPPGSTASAVATMAATGCGAVTAGNVLYTSAWSASEIYRYAPARGTPVVWTNTVLVQNSPSNAVLRQPCAMATDRQGFLYIGDTRPSAAGNEAIIWRLNPTAPVPSATKTLFSVVGAVGDVRGLTFDDAGNLYATVTEQENIYKISASGSSKLFHSFAGRCTDYCKPWGLAFVPDLQVVKPIDRKPPRDWTEWRKHLPAAALAALLALIGGVTLLRRRRRTQT